MKSEGEGQKKKRSVGEKKKKFRPEHEVERQYLIG